MNSIAKFFATASAFTLIMTSVATSAFAEGTSTTEKGNKLTSIVQAGTKEITPPEVITFNPVLDGRIQTEKVQLTKLTVKDATGSGNGWTINVKAEPFKNADASKTLVQSYLNLAIAPTPTNLDGLGEDGFTYKTGKITGSGINVITASKDKGMGTYEFEFNKDALEVVLYPDETYAGESYSTTITWDFTNVTTN